MLKTRPYFMDFVGHFMISGMVLGMSIGGVFSRVIFGFWYAMLFGIVLGGMLGIILGFCDGVVLFGIVRLFRLSPKHSIVYHGVLMVVSALITMSVGYALFDAILREWIALFDNYGAQTITRMVIGIATLATIYTSQRMSRWHVKL